MGLIYLIISLITVWLAILSFLWTRTLLRYRRLTKGVSGKDLLGLWQQYLEKAERNEKVIEGLQVKVGSLAAEGQNHLQRVGVARFNPYGELGGNQSFAISLLDEKGDGMVLSSLHGRDSTRVYAKPVKDFTGTDFELSPEEKDAIHTSQNS